ncbi:MAG: glycosyltransferase family 39 protein [Chloroflexi bacterium]|nr:glycosyltransferase family 39 protein [Chloroflexota bacterium]
MAVVQVDSSKNDFSIYTVVSMLVALVFGVAAQIAVADGNTALGVSGYAMAVVCILFGVRPRLRDHDSTAGTGARRLRLRTIVLVVLAMASGLGTFALSSDNRYRPEGVVLWIISIVCWWLAWADRRAQRSSLSTSHSGLGTQKSVLILLVIILAIGAAFRFANLYDNPREMNSDQAEKLLDIRDVLDGTPYIFFERNTGREPWQFYWTVALIKLFDLRPDFMALKLGTALIGFLMLPAIFLLAREVSDTRTALIAILFAAVASWGVITARFGLRYPLAPCATAWTMYFLVHGLKRNRRNSMLAAGIWLGIGLQGYTAYRFMAPVVFLITLTWIAWVLLRRRRGVALDALINGVLACAMAILVMLPLIRYGTEHPDELFYRAATRLSDAEQPIAGDPVAIFADNLKNVLLMFNVTHDEVWVANLPDRPAMDTILGALLVLGAACAIALSVRQRSPWPALILAAGIFMLIPSALSLAFPRENPSVVRTGGALPMLMVVCALAPGHLLNQVKTTHAQSKTPAYGRPSSAIFLSPPIRLTAWATVTVLCTAVIAINLQRVFVDYPAQYCPRAQNASDIAHEMDIWVAAGHERANAWIVGYPHWVDSRAVGIWIGDITFPNTVGSAVNLPDAATVDLHGQPGWFALNELDAESLQSLKRRYPEGQVQLVQGTQCAEKRFIVYAVP